MPHKQTKIVPKMFFTCVPKCVHEIPNPSLLSAKLPHVKKKLVYQLQSLGYGSNYWLKQKKMGIITNL